MSDEMPDVVSIDPPGAKELDDAIACTVTDDGWLVDVCLPDVPALLVAGGEEDLEAREAGLSLYGPTGVRRSMLRPERVETLSLSHRHERPMVHVRIAVAADLRAEVVSVRRLVHRTADRLTYEEGDRALADAAHPHHARLAALWDLASRLHEDRTAGTGSVFDMDARFYTNEEGKRVDLDERTAYRSNMAVMETMVLANAALARHASRSGVAVLYRNHRLTGFAHGDRASCAAEFALRERVGVHTARQRLRGLAHLVEQAEMGTRPLGHYGLDLPAYAWFTSPLRRYADVVNLRALLDGVVDADLEALGSRLTGLHRSQKDLSDDHHGRVHRSRIARAVSRGDGRSIASADVHTIVRALMENPGFDPRMAMTIVAERMAADQLSGRDMEALLEHADALFGGDAGETVRAWAAQGARAEVLAQHRDGGKTPMPSNASGINHKGLLMERAQARKARVDVGKASRTGPSHAPVFTVEVTWTPRSGTPLGRQATGRTIRDAEQTAAAAVLEALRDGGRDAGPSVAVPQGVAPKTAIIEMGARTPGSEVTFDPAVQTGPPHQPSFAVRLHGRIGERVFDVQGAATSKREAERDASLKAIAAVSGG